MTQCPGLSGLAGAPCGPRNLPLSPGAALGRFAALEAVNLADKARRFPVWQAAGDGA